MDSDIIGFPTSITRLSQVSVEHVQLNCEKCKSFPKKDTDCVVQVLLKSDGVDVLVSSDICKASIVGVEVQISQQDSRVSKYFPYIWTDSS